MYLTVTTPILNSFWSIKLFRDSRGVKYVHHTFFYLQVNIKIFVYLLTLLSCITIKSSLFVCLCNYYITCTLIAITCVGRNSVMSFHKTTYTSIKGNTLILINLCWMNKFYYKWRLDYINRSIVYCMRVYITYYIGLSMKMKTKYYSLTDHRYI